jgi:serine/threonine-protein kinase RsbT
MGPDNRIEIRVLIKSDADIITARRSGRELGTQLGFTSWELAVIATAISELARNLVRYAKQGEVICRTVENGDKRGILVIAQDQGPGIPNIEMALRDGYSTSGGLGLGLPGVRRLMDEFEITSAEGGGTTVKATKWVK